ncbi:MAG: prepilin-type N-terminal cleavage/methylation domain-containing protein [Cyanobacteria bacterium]|nr:prepilin-type N-terminal cleavage/methylation domain-containing protein [Cyanobacteriota bacterium]
MRTDTRPGLAASAGYSLVELMIAMGIFTVIMGVTMSGLASIMKGNELVMAISSMNNSARAGMDLMVRDFLQVGSGLPSSHAVSIPNGVGAVQIRIPGPPGMAAFQTEAGDLVLPALMPRDAQGPTIGGIPTDVVSVLMADNAFLDVRLTATGDETVTVAAGPVLGSGPDRIVAGQLMLISKGSFNTLVQVTNVNAATRVLTFAANDSLRLNQSTTAANGTLRALNNEDPVNDATAMRISRMRMITYYLDDTVDAAHPRLVRRINNGDAGVFDNTLGTAVTIDAVDLQFTYDISNGAGNPSGVEMSLADLGTGGSCAPNACGETQIRKINVLLRSRTPNPNSLTSNFLTTTLESQVSLRAMAFVDRYR